MVHQLASLAERQIVNIRPIDYMPLVEGGGRAVIGARAAEGDLAVRLAAHRGQNVLVAARAGCVVDRFRPGVQHVQAGEAQVRAAQGAVLHGQNPVGEGVDAAQRIVDRRGRVDVGRDLRVEQVPILAPGSKRNGISELSTAASSSC